MNLLDRQVGMGGWCFFFSSGGGWGMCLLGGEG